MGDRVVCGEPVEWNIGSDGREVAPAASDDSGRGGLPVGIAGRPPLESERCIDCELSESFPRCPRR